MAKAAVRTGFYTIKKTDFGKFMDALARSSRVFAPVEADGEHSFRRIKAWSEAEIQRYVNTEFPAKALFHPDGLVMMEYGSGRIKAGPAGGSIILFGIRPCDTHALDVLDRVMTSEYADPYYIKRRASITLLALNCTRAGENCFCGSMGTEKAAGFDLLFSDNGSSFHVEAGSERGLKIISKSRLFRKTGKPAPKARLEFSKKIDTRNLEAAMKASFASAFWDETAKRCLSCASCTSVCPTCYCFDVGHENSVADSGRVKIKRTWSYCMLKSFTTIAGGAVTRESRTERVKQFFYHKLLYGKEKQGKHHCVGCGRCIKECMTRIDITEEAAKANTEYEKRGKA